MTAIPNSEAAAPVLLERCEAGVLRLMLNRPAARNALSVALMRALIEALARARGDRRVRVVVISGAGPAFCAGHDLRELRADARREVYERVFAQCSELMLDIVNLPKPVIAEVHGVATAAGCQLVAACDLAVAADNTSFATPGVKIGLFCTTPMVPLVRTIPPRCALEMLLTGKPISAQQALAWGLVNRVVAADQLDAAVKEFTDAIRASSPLTVRIGKRAFYDQLALDEATAYERATEVMTKNALCRDAQVGMSAFVKKSPHPPTWEGR